MKNYKATDSQMRCRGFQFELGKRYSVEGELVQCENGFHSCDTLKQTTDFYPIPSSRFFEVEVEDTVKNEDKNCSRHITLIREITLYEGLRLLNSKEDGTDFGDDEENSNLGFYNIGKDNRGNCNRGKDNIGNYNIGNYNSGNNNSGNGNSGNGNSGNGNSGNCNSGNCNIGNYNRGNDNRGNGNRGNGNSGNYNSTAL